MSILCQIVFAVILLILVIAMYKASFLLKKLKKLKSVIDFFKKSKPLIACLLSTISVLLLCNAMVQFGKEINFIICSPLEYNEVILLLGTVFPTICVAYYQHMTQKKLNELNETESKELAKKHAKEVEQARKWHIDDLRSKSIHNFPYNSQIRGLVTNFNLPKAQVKFPESKYSDGCYITLGQDDGDCFLYPSYYHVEMSSVYIMTDDKIAFKIEDHNISSKKLSFFVNNQQINEYSLHQFFNYPWGSHKITLQIKVDLYGEDRSMRINGAEFLDLNCSILLTVEPMDGGYDEDGKFGMITHSIELSQLAPIK